MGVYADFLSTTYNNVTDLTAPIVANDRPAYREIYRRYSNVDPAYKSAFQAKDAVVSLSANDHTGGTFTITVTLENGETFTTAAIAFDANAATIEGAIDTAATAASITDWTNGDISVSGGAANANPVVFTFDGDSVTETNPTVTNDGDSLTGGTDDGTVSVTTYGQGVRRGLALLYELGVINLVNAYPTPQGSTPVVGQYTVNSPGTREGWPGQPTIKEAIDYLVNEEDETEYRNVFYTLLGYDQNMG